MEVIFTIPFWEISGVIIFTANLIRELIKKNINTKLLITQPFHLKEKIKDIPSYIPFDLFDIRKKEYFLHTHVSKNLKAILKNSLLVYTYLIMILIGCVFYV